MSIVIIRTSAGAQKEQDAILQGAPLPKLGRMAFINHSAVTDAIDVSGIVTIPESEISHFVSSENLSFKRIAASNTTQISAHIPPLIECVIKAIALILEDGTVWGYAPYRVASNGLIKTTDFGITILCVVTHSDGGSISITYDPLDTFSIAEHAIEYAGTELETNHEKAVTAHEISQINGLRLELDGKIGSEGGVLLNELQALGVGKTRPAFVSYLANL